jgi:hypothetical protein
MQFFILLIFLRSKIKTFKKFNLCNIRTILIFKKGIVVLLTATILHSTVGAQSNDSLKLRHQISFAVENDVLAFRGTDGYYTSGLLANFSILKRNNRQQNLKTIYNYEIGQQIFTPGIREVYVITEIDRPITGYLYGKFSIDHFKTKNRVLSYGASIGAIGKMAQGQKVLNWFHPFIKINSDWWGWMWKYQLKNEIGLNLHASFAKSLINSSSLSFLQVTPKTDVTLGTTFTSLRQSVIVQIGKHNANAQSSYWGSRIGNNAVSSDKKELFFFYRPQLLYQLYNATIQGGMFRQDKGDITSDLERFVVANEFGAVGSSGRYSASFHLTFQSREAFLQEKNHAFGRLQVSFLF